MRRTSSELSKVFVWLTALAMLLCTGRSETARPQSGSAQQSLDFVIFCKDDFAVARQQSGISAIELKTGRIVWSALSGKDAYVGPAAAGDSVGVITDSFNSIYAFSKGTGKPLWRKSQHSNVLASDGKYFYAARYEDGALTALDPRTGAIVWTADMPPRGYLVFLWVKEGLLYTDRFVSRARNGKMVHQWPEDIVVTTIAFPRPGEALLGDTDGNLTLYDSAFKVTNRFHAGDTAVDAIAANGDGILVSLCAEGSSRGVIEFLTWDGHERWHVPGLPGGLHFNPFVIVAHDGLIVEPGESEKRWRFESRGLATGKVNWTAPEAEYFLGWTVVCGNTVFLRDGDQIKGFNISDGTPWTGE